MVSKQVSQGKWKAKVSEKRRLEREGKSKCDDDDKLEAKVTWSQATR